MIPLVNLVRQYEALKSDIDAAVQAVCASGRYVNGPFVEQFEADFAAYLGTPHAVGVASGTSALHLALVAAGVGPGDEVVTTPATFVATVAAVIQAGATPVLADIEPGGTGLDPEAARRAITGRTRALLPVHLYGHACDMTALSALAREAGLALIEDCSQAHGARWRGRRVGVFGDAAAFSLYPAKNLGGLGDGGIVTTPDPALADRVRRLRNWAQGEDRLHHEPAFNARLDAVNAAVLSVKLKHLDAWSAHRRTTARRYAEALAGTPLAIRSPHPDSESVWHVVDVRHAQSAALRERLAARGVETGVHYAAPIHLQPAYRSLGRPGRFPHAEALFRDQFSLPICGHIAADETDAVIAGLKDALLTLEGGSR